MSKTTDTPSRTTISICWADKLAFKAILEKCNTALVKRLGINRRQFRQVESSEFMSFVITFMQQHEKEIIQHYSKEQPAEPAIPEPAKIAESS